MRVAGFEATRHFPAAGWSKQDSRSDTSSADSRALVAVGPVEPCERVGSVSRRPFVGFLAQLVATDRLAPQTCARRRATPAEAIAAYMSVAAMASRQSGKRLRRGA